MQKLKKKIQPQIQSVKNIPIHLLKKTFFSFILALPHSLSDLSSQARDQTWDSDSESVVSQQLDNQEILSPLPTNILNANSIRTLVK